MNGEAGRYDIRPVRYTKKKKRVGIVEHMDIIHRGTGEVGNSIGIVYEEVKVDASPFVKVYDVVRLTNLSAQGLRLLMFVMQELKYDGTVEIDEDRAKAFAGWKDARSVRYALKDLMDNDIVRKRNGYEYYVDPNVIGKGMRDINQTE